MDQQNPYLIYEWPEPNRLFCPNYDFFAPLQNLFPIVRRFSGDSSGLRDSSGFHFMSVIENLEQCMKHTRMRNCTNEKCLQVENTLARVAPECEWGAFRAWALKVMACWSTSEKTAFDIDAHPNATRGKISPHIAAARIPMSLPVGSARMSFRGTTQRLAPPPNMAIYFCTKLLGSLELMDWNYEVGFHTEDDFFGVVELLIWMSNATDFVPNPRIMRNYVGVADDLELPLHMRRLNRAIFDVSNLQSNFCRRRLWNLVLACRSGIASIPSIMSILNTMPATDTRVHAQCTPETCQFDEENSTTVRQLHQCGLSESDHRIKCDPSKLNHSTLPHNAWTMKRELTGGKFMAISHIWLDGTGSSINTEAGTVNECLFDFFTSVAQREGCEGIWWDAICMPSDRKKWAEEISRMHQNYSNAEFTLVHDLQLANFEWMDDGSPCLALALSAWFTRGWTALELRASKKVKVLFKAPAQQHGGQTVPEAGFMFQYNGHREYRYVLKDLDDDILASGKSIFTRPAHQEVSLVIQTVRGRAQGDLTKLNQLMFAMKNRHTSWGRDRMIITSLMADPRGLESGLTAPEITKKLLVEYVTRITPHSLLHGNMTMCSSGPWSWCPPVLLDLAEDEEGYDSLLTITPDGELTGTWATKTLTKEELAKLSPVGSHPSTVIRIKRYLTAPKEVLILDKRFVVRLRTMTDAVANDRYLLVTKPGLAGRSTYIGVVSGEIDWISGRVEQDIIIG